MTRRLKKTDEGRLPASGEKKREISRKMRFNLKTFFFLKEFRGIIMNIIQVISGILSGFEEGCALSCSGGSVTYW